MAILSSAIDASSAEFRANAEKMRALTARIAGAPRRGRIGRLGKIARSPCIARKTSSTRKSDEPDRFRLAVPGTVAARRLRHVRRRHPCRRHHHRHRPRRGARMHDRGQRRHHQRRQLSSDDGEEASACAGDRAREPAALHLSGRLGRRQSADADRSIPRPRAFRPHLLQPGGSFEPAHSADRGGDGLLHRRRRLCAGDVGRDHHRQESGHHLPRRPAFGEGGNRRSGERRGPGRRRSACAQVGRRRSSGAGRPSRAVARAPHRRQSQQPEERRHSARARRASRR